MKKKILKFEHSKDTDGIATVFERYIIAFYRNNIYQNGCNGDSLQLTVGLYLDLDMLSQSKYYVLVDILYLDRRLCLTVYLWIRTSRKSNDQYVHHSIFLHLNKDECLKFRLSSVLYYI